ncbi:MAG: oxidoreductase [Deltaproteobacteria bacterium]|nr:oxidoreductase [Deltaproteobacteria bacterium]
MARYAMVIDVSRCNGCYNCFLACRDEFAGNDYLPWSVAQPESGHRWIDVREVERGIYPKVKVSYIPRPCMHCEEAGCIGPEAQGAVFRRPDGIVIIDPAKSKGLKTLSDSCPYGAIYWNEEKNLPQKCTFCAHLLDLGWKEPRCVEACPTGALIFGDLEDPESGISQRWPSGELEDLHPEFGARPLVRYVGLPKTFIAGEVVLGDRMEECAQGIKVTVISGSQELSIETDNFGDFEFEGLEGDKEYRLVIEQEGYARRELQVSTRADLNLGEIPLKPLG